MTNIFLTQCFYVFFLFDFSIFSRHFGYSVFFCLFNLRWPISFLLRLSITLWCYKLFTVTWWHKGLPYLLDRTGLDVHQGILINLCLKRFLCCANNTRLNWINYGIGLSIDFNTLTILSYFWNILLNFSFSCNMLYINQCLSFNLS